MGKQNDAFTAYLGRAEVLADLYNGCLYQGLGFCMEPGIS